MACNQSLVVLIQRLADVLTPEMISLILSSTDTVVVIQTAKDIAVAYAAP